MATTQGGVSRERCIELREQGYSQRLIAELLNVAQSTVRYHTRNLRVETARGRNRRTYHKGDAIPLPPSDDLAYLIGVFAGDGFLTRLPRTVMLGISCDNRYPELMLAYVDLFSRLLNRRVSLKPHNGSACTEVVAFGLDLPTLLDLPTGRKSENGFAVPEWIFENPTYTALFMRGMVETDGGIYKRKRPDKGRTWECIFCAVNENIMQAFLRSAEQLGFPFHRKGKRASLSNTGKVRAFMELCGITKCCDYENLLESTTINNGA